MKGKTGIVVALAVGALALAAPAQAAPTCTYTAATKTLAVTLPGPGDQTKIFHGGNGSIFLSGIACSGSPTISNTNTVNVTGGAGYQAFSISLGNGGFSRTILSFDADIVFNVDLGAGQDSFMPDPSPVVGAHIAFGLLGVNLDAPDVSRDVTLTNIENIQVPGGTGNDIFSGAGGFGTGGPSAVQLSLGGGAGNDVLTGGSHDYDSLSGGPGNDTLNGGAGVGNSADYQFAPAGVFVSLPDGHSSGGDGSDTFSNIQRVSSSAFADVLIGDALANRLDGNGGNDVIRGGGGVDDLEGWAGNDELHGGDGNDFLGGGDGADTLQGDGGSNFLMGGANAANTYDVVSYADATSGVTVSGFSGGNAQGTDSFSQIEAVRGSEFADTLTGTAGNDILIGAGGNDTIHGGAGNDLVEGDAGTNGLDGGTGFDLATFVFSAGPVQAGIAAGGAKALGELDGFKGIEGLYGSPFGDTLVGDAAVNLIYGAGGDDTLNGLAGNDTIHGGKGNDTIDGGANTDACTQDAGSGAITNCE
jgi:Ca2+-binding RTX toxin-like protein